MKTVLAVIGCLFCGITAQLPAQEVKIATVNVARVLDQYVPYVEGVSKIKELWIARLKGIEEQKSGLAHYQELIGKWEAAQKRVNDKSPGKQARDEARKELDALTKEAKKLERQLDLGRDSGRRDHPSLEVQLYRFRKTIVDEIRKVVDEQALQGRWDFILDLSPASEGGGGLLWAKPAKFPDLTQAVLAELKRRDEVKQLYTVVNGAEFFSIGGVGEAGQPSAAETAFRELLKAPDAMEQCRMLLEDGKPVGRLYGFLGLKQLNFKDWPLSEAQILKNRNTIRLMSGRRKTEHFVSEIAKQIAQGKLK